MWIFNVWGGLLGLYEPELFILMKVIGPYYLDISHYACACTKCILDLEK